MEATTQISSAFSGLQPPAPAIPDASGRIYQAGAQAWNALTGIIHRASKAVAPIFSQASQFISANQPMVKYVAIGVLAGTILAVIAGILLGEKPEPGKKDAEADNPPEPLSRSSSEDSANTPPTARAGSTSPRATAPASELRPRFPTTRHDFEIDETPEGTTEEASFHDASAAGVGSDSLPASPEARGSERITVDTPPPTVVSDHQEEI